MDTVRRESLPCAASHGIRREETAVSRIWSGARREEPQSVDDNVGLDRPARLARSAGWIGFAGAEGAEGTARSHGSTEVGLRGQPW